MLNAHSCTFPIQINQGVLFVMTITHDESDTMIIQQVDYVGVTNILIVADDNMHLGSWVSLCKTMTALGMPLLFPQ